MTLPELLDVLEAFDGKHTAGLEAISKQLAHGTPPVDELITLAESPHAHVQVGATWLLKRLRDQRIPLTGQHVGQLVDVLGQVDPWGARLHVLQALAGCTIPKHKKDDLYAHLHGLLMSPNKFVRAWTYSALVELAEQHPAFRPEVMGLVQRGADAEPASVRARIRNVRNIMASW